MPYLRLVWSVGKIRLFHRLDKHAYYIKLGSGPFRRIWPPRRAGPR